MASVIPEWILLLAWIGLIVALILTVPVVRYALAVIRKANEIARLAERTLSAAVGILNNTAPIAELEKTRGVAGQLLATAGAIDAGAASVRRKVEAVGQALGGGR